MFKPYINYKNYIEATLLCDFYKLCHRLAYPKGTEEIYSTFIHRNNRYLPIATGAVVINIQGFVKKYLIDYFNEYFFNRPKEEVIQEYKNYIKGTLGEDAADAKHLEQLHDLGYLPIRISALPEGTIAPAQVPILTIHNTHKDFYWLTNYLETLISCELWQPMTSASISHAYRKLLEKFAIQTTGSVDGVDFQAHDFSMRGMSSLESAMLSGAGHLLSFYGTDTFPAIMYLVKYYNADINNELVGTSVNATEHSVMCANTPADSDRDEYQTFKRLITEVFPKGIASLVSDSYDFWKVVDVTIPSLKDIIMQRDGKVVIRPDSGDPRTILCGKKYKDLTNEPFIESLEDTKDYFSDKVNGLASAACGDGTTGEDNYDFEFKYADKYYKIHFEVRYNCHDKRYYYAEEVTYKGIEEIFPTSSDLGLVESLWNIFGGTVTEQGYKVLDSHIGTIYGDSITYDLAKTVCEDLAEKGFASTNVTFGIGSYTFQYNTRDGLSFAMKATSSIVNGEEHLLFKDPKTDHKKRSNRGRVYVTRNANGIYESYDGFTKETLALKEKEKPNELRVVFEDGKLLIDETLSTIRERLANEVL